MSFEGAAASPCVEGEDRAPGVQDYFIGNDESGWRTHVPLHTAVRYRGKYPGIDVRVRRAGDHPDYDLLLEPGADLDHVVVRVEGVGGLHLDADSALILETELGAVRQPAPKTWEDGAFGRRALCCSYVVLGPDRFGFAARDWDTETRLTIDPGLIWCTYLGGSGADVANGFDVDAAGVVAAVGQTNVPNFPTTLGAHNSSNKAGAAWDTRGTLPRVEVGAGERFCWLALGATRANFACGPCTLVPDPVAVLPATTDPLGNGEVSFRIRANLALRGQSFLAQWLLVAPGGCLSLELSFSNAIQVTIE